jgi:hypothetical protein
MLRARQETAGVMVKGDARALVRVARGPAVRAECPHRAVVVGQRERPVGVADQVGVENLGARESAV